jgi:hypothetical protein
MTAGFCLSSGAMGTWWKALTKVIFMKMVQQSMLAEMSISLGKGYLFGTVMVLSPAVVSAWPPGSNLLGHHVVQWGGQG